MVRRESIPFTMRPEWRLTCSWYILVIKKGYEASFL
jgi:hypothetical protein